MAASSYSQFIFNDAANLLLGEAEFHQASDCRADQPYGLGHHPAALDDGPRDIGAGTLSKLNDAFVLELPVRANHRIWIDHEFFRQATNCREPFARSKRTGFDAMPDLLHQLQIDRNARGMVEMENH